MSQKPTIPKGTRDFGPEKMNKRNIIFSAIKNVFQKYGFMPLETPTMENLSVLTGKYGNEGDQLLFKVLNSGDFLSKTSVGEYEKGSKTLLPKIAEKGLRYDLTVPFARYVVMHQHEITYPFKRYQIQPVWRADRPQKGRYREFYQCDADIVGTASLVCETEIVLMINEVFDQLGIKDFSIKINHRKVLSGIANLIGAAGKETDFFVAIDKLDKIGIDGVLKELTAKDFSAEAIERLQPLLTYKGNTSETLAFLQNSFNNNPEGLKGVDDVKEVLSYLEAYELANDHLDFDITLARGLSYYTGVIFEVKVNNVNIGSVSGGGRYDDLTGVFGLEGVSGVGFSFGVDRLYDVMEELDIFPESSLTSTIALVAHFDGESQKYGIKVLSSLRKAGIKSEIYPDLAKPKKQFNYANKKNIPYVIIIGANEMATGQLMLKNMGSGDQEQLSVDEIIKKLSHHNGKGSLH